MKKVLYLIIVMIFIAGCTMNEQAKMSVEDYLNSYKSLNDSVSSELDKLIESEDLTSNQKKVYRKVLERQYKNLQYEIIDERYEENSANILVRITVYDYYKVQQDILKYLKENRKQFYKDGKYDESSYLDYKLDTMLKYNETITYDIEFNLIKQSNKWILKKLKTSDIEKIHGIYNYSND